MQALETVHNFTAAIFWWPSGPCITSFLKYLSKAFAYFSLHGWSCDLQEFFIRSGHKFFARHTYCKYCLLFCDLRAHFKIFLLFTCPISYWPRVLQPPTVVMELCISPFRSVGLCCMDVEVLLDVPTFRIGVTSCLVILSLWNASFCPGSAPCPEGSLACY